MKKRLVFLVALMGYASYGMAQEQLIREGSADQRRTVVRALPPDTEKARAIQLAERVGIPQRMIYPDGRIMEIRSLNPNQMPEYLTTYNSNAAKTVSTDKVWGEAGLGFDLTGEGIMVGVWDGGLARSTHIEFEDRALDIDVGAEIVGHATHVSGTIGASGIDEMARGMANKVVLEGYDWDQDIAEMDAAASQGLLLSNHSYGFATGWDKNKAEDRWEWRGDVSISEEEDYRFGYYHPEAAGYDRVAYKYPNYLIMKSAGNDRGEGPSSGAEHYVWEDGDWVLSTTVRQKDGGSDGFDCIGPVGNAKNILTVGAIRDLPWGYQGPESPKLMSFSASGPTDDGRIKPDLVANGENLYSTYSGSDSDYSRSSGTSMSTPNATGSLALIQEQHFNQTGSYLTSAALKGLILHTADDAGNKGPDYKFGWGVLNTLQAVELISDDSFDRIHEVSLSEGGEYRLRLFADGFESVRVTICWTDPPGSVPEPALNPIDRILLNDLDLRLVRVTDGYVHQPYVLDPINPNQPAISGDNLVDNTEQILIESPPKGFYELIVTHKESLINKKQNFAVIFSGLTDEFFASDLTEIEENNGEFILTSAPEYLPNMDASWLIRPENNLPITLYFNYFSTESIHDSLIIYDGPDNTAPVLARLSGTLDPEAHEYKSSTGSLFIRFVSNGQVQDRGFMAVFCTTAPEVQAIIQGESYPCLGSSELYLATGVSGVEFLWTPPDGWKVDSLISDGSYLNVGTGGGQIKVLTQNRCGSGPESSLELYSLDSVPGLSGYVADTVPCAGLAAFVEVEELEGANYNWRLPTLWLGNSISNTLDYIPGYENGVITLNVDNACGSGDTIQVPITVQAKPGETLIKTSRDKPCAMSQQNFYVVSLEDHLYTWEAQDDWAIIGNNDLDTVLVAVGSESNFLFVNATNKCGTRQSNKLFITSPLPERPLVKVNNSEYEGYKLLSVTNTSTYSGYQWNRNNIEIQSSMATNSQYVAYLPGTYTVSVTNKEDCVLKQDLNDGTELSQDNQTFSIYAGQSGKIIVLNSTNSQASVNIYSYSGQLLTITTIDPGYNEIPFENKGAIIISVSGPDKSHITRLFTH